jgi:hypothetical protein
MEPALTFRCSENDTLLDAVGKTIAVERYNGVNASETTTETTKATLLMIKSTFLFFHKNAKRADLS